MSTVAFNLSSRCLRKLTFPPRPPAPPHPPPTSLPLSASDGLHVHAQTALCKRARVRALPAKLLLMQESQFDRLEMTCYLLLLRAARSHQGAPPSRKEPSRRPSWGGGGTGGEGGDRQTFWMRSSNYEKRKHGKWYFRLTLPMKN